MAAIRQRRGAPSQIAGAPRCPLFRNLSHRSDIGKDWKMGPPDGTPYLKGGTPWAACPYAEADSISAAEGEESYLLGDE